jgi:hypothetical protein
MIGDRREMTRRPALVIGAVVIGTKTELGELNVKG